MLVSIIWEAVEKIKNRYKQEKGSPKTSDDDVIMFITERIEDLKEFKKKFLNLVEKACQEKQYRLIE